MDTRRVTQFFKGIAILFVVLCHSHQTFTLPGKLNDSLYFLQTGVQLFIILSSFGLCFSYRKEPVSWFDFMKRRFSKIAIFYWFAIVLAAIYRLAYAVVMHNNILREINPVGILMNALFLHGFSPDDVINNHIVRGGWYIGTIVILYALFPFMYRLYFRKGKIWAASRMYAFPLLVFAVTSILHLFLQSHEALDKLLLQLGPFSLGFPLFELQTANSLSKFNFPLRKGIVFAILACALFFSNSVISWAYVFCIAIAFFCFIVSVLKKDTLRTAIHDNSNPVVRFFSAMGNYSYPIYLIQSYIAFDFCYVFTAVMSKFYSNDLLWFIVLQPIVVALCFYVGKCFHIVVSQIMRLHKS